jgi:hypothetical protein
VIGMSKHAKDTAAQARAEVRRISWTIRRYNHPDEMKAAEYAWWQSQPAHVRLAAISEVSTEQFAMKGIRVSRLQRTLSRVERS